ncbi:hypothetical protein PDIG_52950 [Penicillium digitatum PHI26]|uniref:Uncharacterized protein n=2 Tax=Penicillium digitatum TaxID=36651 RepID=K9FRJ1_PEND2|nr:hypothetical protein PDIP_48170 [Penicillium digitatum Pd1]EKV11042.1 hypothetical protein PDIG_52950 [Penicillium digitatum PHI26]EKV13412.1 hypothetical protein PDIP_48170 [Penicillium digitatum Pd1]
MNPDSRSQPREEQSPGSLNCNRGRIRALIQTSDGERHYFSGTVSTDLCLMVNNAQPAPSPAPLEYL